MDLDFFFEKIAAFTTLTSNADPGDPIEDTA
jgi:hypothetical protein